jgi:hypothetical protein
MALVSHPSQTAPKPLLSRPKNGEPFATLKRVAFIAAFGRR